MAACAPGHPFVSLMIVPEGPDVADKWIAEHCGPGDVVVTADIPLADRCLKAGAQVVQHDGEVLTPANIGGRLATRDLMQDIRSANPFHQGGGGVFQGRPRAVSAIAGPGDGVAALRVPRG